MEKHGKETGKVNGKNENKKKNENKIMAYSEVVQPQKKKESKQPPV